MTKPKTVPRLTCWGLGCTNKVPAYRTGPGNRLRHYCSRLCYRNWTPEMKRACHRVRIPESRAGLRRYIVQQYQRQVQTPAGIRFRTRTEIANDLGIAPATVSLWLESLKDKEAT